MKNTPISRRIALAALASLPVAARSLRYGAAEDDVNAVIKRAVDGMANVKSFHFKMETLDGTATIMGSLELRGVEGDVVRPASFQATLDAKASIVAVDVQVVSINGSVWITNPLQAGKWEQVANGADAGDGSISTLTSLINPDRLFLIAIQVLEDPSIDGNEEIDGTATTRVVGQFYPNSISTLTGLGTATPADAPNTDFLSSDPVDLRFWVADDGKVLRIEEEGPLTDTESRDVLRRFSFTDFDKPVDIEPPV
jgi:hypothetical protein